MRLKSKIFEGFRFLQQPLAVLATLFLVLNLTVPVSYAKQGAILCLGGEAVGGDSALDGSPSPKTSLSSHCPSCLPLSQGLGLIPPAGFVVLDVQFSVKEIFCGRYEMPISMFHQGKNNEARAPPSLV